MKISQHMFSFCLGMVTLSHGLIAEKIERLTPPILTSSTIDQKITCTRPMREGKFNISAEQQEDKVLVHCYGHGGSGCTTSWGSVFKAIDLYEKNFTVAKDTPIRVIGAGIIGLTTAIELTRMGYTVAGITAKELYEIPSWKNAGYFALVSVKTDPVEQKNLDDIGVATFLEYKKISDGTHPYISSDCARFIPVYASEETDAGVEDLEQKGLIPPRELVTLDFGNGVRHPNFVKFMTYFMDTTRVMLQLRQEVDRLGIPIENKELTSFGEIAESVVFNCSGLGGKKLNSDNQMIAVRGHLANLNAEAGSEHMEYMIYTKVKNPDGTEAHVYMFPKCLQVTEATPLGHIVYGTLGGTFIPGTDNMTKEQLEKLDKKEFKKLLDRNSLFFWGKPFKEHKFFKQKPPIKQKKNTETSE
ncbi:MAG: FAD-binding oxidoreductase [Rhabdochlamydiaceae bacterium]|nr:FAD-binding oxidoreductase [Rhabdochlamydiaceae bacterium]